MDIDLEIIKTIFEQSYELHDDFQKYSKIYLNTTENIKGILDGIDIKDKKVLSVAGSGDQALNAYFLGASNVTLFDINPLAGAQAELKFTAAQKLDYEEFYKFFLPLNGCTLRSDTYKKLSNYLSDETNQFFDYLYSNYNNVDIFNKIAYDFYPTISTLERVNAYMGEDNFKELKNKLDGKEINFIEASLIDLPNNLNNLYDIMLLSNISDSINNIWNINTLKNYKRYIHILSKHLNKEGIIQCGYIYNSYDGHTSISDFAYDERRRKVFTPNEFKERDITSYQFHSSKDKVITFEKKRRKVS